MPIASKLTTLAALALTTALAHAQITPANTVAWPSTADSPLGQQILTMISAPEVSRAHWGIAVTTLDGTPILGLNQGQLFRPASNAKLFTTVTALALFGPAQRFETRVITTGSIDANGILHGDLRLEGRGDANFGEEDIPYIRPADRPKGKPPVTNIPDIEDLARKIAAKGVHSVDGGIIASDAYFAATPYPSDWAWDDLLWAYGAPVSALTIHDNELDVTVTPAATAGEPATISVIPDDTPYYTIVNQVLTTPGPGSCDARLTITFDDPTRTLTLQGAIAPGHAPCKETLAIQNPTRYAAVALKAALARHNIQVTGDITIEHNSSPDVPPSPEEATQAKDDLARILSAPQLTLPCAAQPDPGPKPTPAATNQTLLATHAAPPLRLDLIYTNKVSDNLHAEIFLRNLPSAFCQPRTLRNSLRIRGQFLTTRAGIDPADVLLYDGSGLSGHDLVTPRATAQLLRFAATQPWFADWKTSLPVAGEDGTLGSRFANTPLKDHIFAKTGTLSESRALSGYLDTASGKTLIFSIMVDTHTPGSADQQAMDKILTAIAAAN